MAENTDWNPALFNIFFELILVHNFQSPITWTMVGANRAILRGKWEFNLDPEAGLSQRSNFTATEGQARDLRLPIDLFLTDKEGRSANILFQKDGKHTPILREITQA
jgi:hypothetical protein